MTSSTTSTHAKSSPALLPALQRLGVPVLLFSVIFLIGTFLLTLLLTPDRFPVRIGDRTVRMRDLEEEQQKLLEQKAEFLTRTSPVSDARSPVLAQLTKLRASQTPVGQTLMSISDARASFRSAVSDPIAIPTIEVRTSEKKILLGGIVKDADGRSMQILASFVDSLRSISSVVSVSEPEYTQSIGTDGIGASPFSLTLTLR